MQYKIITAQWFDANHERLNLEVCQTNEDTKDKEEFFYTATCLSVSPRNDFLWQLAMEHPELIKECETTLILSGKIPLPKGRTIIGQRIFYDVYQAGLIRNAIQDQLNILNSPEIIEKAEKDEKYAARRNKIMKNLSEIENQEGFPYDVDWYEVQ